MKVNVIHPRSESLEVISGAIDTGVRIARSPHVGNINPNEMALIAGLGAMGANVRLLMVDSIQGQDNYSSPRVIKTRHRTAPICSNKNSSNRVVGACSVSASGVDEVAKLGIGINLSEGMSLTDIHMSSLRGVLPEGMSAELASKQFAQLGREVLHSVLEASSSVVDHNLRVVGEDGKISVHEGPISIDNMFGVGTSPLQGVLVPVEAMMAIDILESAIKNDGQDSQVVHVAGNDMARYTADEDLMGQTINIVHKVGADLGLLPGTVVSYVLPERSSLLASPMFPNGLLPADMVSQYDLIR